MPAFYLCIFLSQTYATVFYTYANHDYYLTPIWQSTYSNVVVANNNNQLLHIIMGHDCLISILLHIMCVP